MYSRCTYLIFAFFCVSIYAKMLTDLQKLEDEFLKSGVGDEKNRSYPSIFARWNEDRWAALCERALNNSEQFDTGVKNSKDRIWPTMENKTVIFKHEKPKHGPINAEVIKCPAGKYIHESGRVNDCYYIMVAEKDSVVIEKEVCELGLM